MASLKPIKTRPGLDPRSFRNKEYRYYRLGERVLLFPPGDGAELGDALILDGIEATLWEMVDNHMFRGRMVPEVMNLTGMSKDRANDVVLAFLKRLRAIDADIDWVDMETWDQYQALLDAKEE